MASSTMHAVGVAQYGAIANLQSREVPKPSKPTGREMLVQVKAISVNPIDMKVRAGTYDDPPDYYERVKSLLQEPPHFHIIGYDGAGIVLETGPDVKYFKPGNEIFYLANPVKQGTYAEQVLVDERHAGHKPGCVDFVQAAAMPLTYATAYESLVNRLEIKEGEKAAILIINGGGGMGSIASQIARYVCKLPVVITTASRPETIAYTKKMGATHVVNHREDIVKQIRALNLPADTPLKYAYITSRTEQYLFPIAEVIAPFGKICSIVQAKFDMYGSQMMGKSLTFSWCWLASGAYHHYVNDQEEKHHDWYEQLGQYLGDGTIKCHLMQRLKATAEGIREAHRILDAGTAIGKMALGVDEPGLEEAFC
ncbi:quinone oxidoreductase [Hypoxylon trugodes]|uniref:quinone oxidoreductase n=1 Tax=Hypoxylon trugodes TaxID=326681 RepID=UPI002192C905|nr:quinone oxidoreductase [Hypoxylon trugodes]KAI1388701.1 quinone oxidoreductase [Hypoxylon trugodes]